MLINGEKEIGVTALIAEKDYDSGDIILQKSCNVTYPITIQEAIDKIKVLYFEIVEELLEQALSKKVMLGKPQDESAATFSCWRDKLDYYIDWKAFDSAKIERFVNALGSPYNGAITTLNGIIIHVMKVISHDNYTVESPESNIGKVLFCRDGHAFVVCIKGLLEIVDAHYLNGDSIYPLSKFRSRFGNEIT